MASPKNKRRIQRHSIPHRNEVKWRKICNELDVRYNRMLQTLGNVDLTIETLKREALEEMEREVRAERFIVSKEYLIDKELES